MESIHSLVVLQKTYLEIIFIIGARVTLSILETSNCEGLPLSSWTVLIVVVLRTVFRESDGDEGGITRHKHIGNGGIPVVKNVYTLHSHILVGQLAGGNQHTYPRTFGDCKTNVFELE